MLSTTVQQQTCFCFSGIGLGRGGGGWRHCMAYTVKGAMSTETGSEVHIAELFHHEEGTSAPISAPLASPRQALDGMENSGHTGIFVFCVYPPLPCYVD